MVFDVCSLFDQPTLCVVCSFVCLCCVLLNFSPTMHCCCALLCLHREESALNKITGTLVPLVVPLRVNLLEFH